MYVCLCVCVQVEVLVACSFLLVLVLVHVLCTVQEHHLRMVRVHVHILRERIALLDWHRQCMLCYAQRSRLRGFTRAPCTMESRSRSIVSRPLEAKQTAPKVYSTTNSSAPGPPCRNPMVVAFFVFAACTAVRCTK